MMLLVGNPTAVDLSGHCDVGDEIEIRVRRRGGQDVRLGKGRSTCPCYHCRTFQATDPPMCFAVKRCLFNPDGTRNEAITYEGDPGGEIEA